MNPQGKWIMHNLELQFVSEEIMAIYGKVYPQLRGEATLWYWEARTSLESRVSVSASPFCGYAHTKEDACSIVEQLLYLTKTVTPKRNTRPLEDALTAKLEKAIDILTEIGDKFEGLPPGDIANDGLHTIALMSEAKNG